MRNLSHETTDHTHNPFQHSKSTNLVIFESKILSILRMYAFSNGIFFCKNKPWVKNKSLINHLGKFSWSPIFPIWTRTLPWYTLMFACTLLISWKSFQKCSEQYQYFSYVVYVIGTIRGWCDGSPRPLEHIFFTRVAFWTICTALLKSLMPLHAQTQYL